MILPPDLEARAKDLLAEFGFIPPSTLQTAKPFGRCATVSKPKRQNGSYTTIQAEDGRWILYMHNWETGEAVSEFLIPDAAWAGLSEDGRSALSLKARMEQLKWEKEQETARRIAKEYIDYQMRELPQATGENPYLKRKGVPPCRVDLRTRAGELVVPGYNIDSELVTLQTISDTGEKKFVQDTSKTGASCTVKAWDNRALMFGEGVATVLSAARFTGFGARICFDCDNLVRVAVEWRRRLPRQPFVILADNDCTDRQGRPRRKNVGVLKAMEAAKLTGSALAICPAINGKSADFNDLDQTGVRGWLKLCEVITGALEKKYPWLDLSRPPRFNCENEKARGTTPGPEHTMNTMSG